MKSILTACLLIITANGLLAQKITLNQGGTTERNYYEEIPYETSNGKIFIYADIEGKKHKFLFDTGAPVSINKNLADQLNSHALETIVAKDVLGVRDSAEVVELNGIKLGNITFNHIPATTLFPDIYKCWDISGVIGSNIFYNSIISLDAERKLIILTDQLNKLPLQSVKGNPMVKVGGQNDPKIRIVFPNDDYFILGFDTGDNGFLRMPEELMRKKRLTESFIMLSKGYGSSILGLSGKQTDTDKYLLKLSSLSISGIRFDNVIIETHKTVIPGIGTKLLDYGILTLDFIHSKFYFAAHTKINDMMEKSWPVIPTFQDNKLVIGTVWDKAVGKFEPGEQIISIDGKNYENVTICDLINNKPVLADKQTASITVKDNRGTVKTVQVDME